MKTKINISPQALRVLSLLEASGFEAYLVGGCVRDSLMGLIPHDEDIATNATVKDMKNVFGNFKIIETGIKHMTLSVVVEKKQIEVTSYRTEGEYADFRKPNNVKIASSIEEDLSRRDFTINAIAYSPNRGFVDIYGGREDIENKRIRAVGCAKTRFNEDALRMMRAIRFFAVLGFSMEAQTKKAIFVHKQNLMKISMERINSEFSKILLGQNASEAIREYFSVITVFLPELTPFLNFDQHNGNHCYTLLEHTLCVVKSVPPVLRLRLAALFHDIGKIDTFRIEKDGQSHFHLHPEISEQKTSSILKRMKYDNKTRNDVLTLIKYHDRSIGNTTVDVKRMLALVGEDLFFDLLSLKHGDEIAHVKGYFAGDDLEKIKECAKEILCTSQCYREDMLKINGDDILALGEKNGKRIGEIKKLLLEDVICERVENSRRDLIGRAKEYIK